MDDALYNYHFELLGRPQIKHLLDAKYLKIYPPIEKKEHDDSDYYTEIQMSAQCRPLVKQNTNYGRIYKKLMSNILGCRPVIDIDFKRLSNIIPSDCTDINKIYRILKKHKLSIYYRHIVYIRNTIHNINNHIDHTISDQIKRAFILIQPHRKGIPQTFILYKFLEDHGLEDLMNNIIKNTQWKAYNKRWLTIE